MALKIYGSNPLEGIFTMNFPEKGSFEYLYSVLYGELEYSVEFILTPKLPTDFWTFERIVY